MAKIYTKGVWVDEVLAAAERYNTKTDAGVAIESDIQIELATDVVVAGTALTASRMNNIEAGIDTLDDINNEYTTGGTSTAFTLTTPQASSLATGEHWRIVFHATAGVSPTLNRDGKGAKALKQYDSSGAKVACSASTIISGMRSEIIYDGTDYIVFDALPSSADHALLVADDAILAADHILLNERLITPYTTAGSSTAFTITTPSAPSLATGEHWRVVFNATAGATPTLNRDGKGAKALKQYNSAGAKVACSATTIISGMVADVWYDGVDYVLLNALPPLADPSVLTHAATTKATPVDADEIPLVDSAASFVLKKLTWANLKATLNTYLATLFAAADGWISVSDSWAYATANTITVPSGAASKYSKGDRIRFTQHGTVKYFYASGIADTVLTVTAGTANVVENTGTYPITSISYSHEPLPIGFPAHFICAAPTWDTGTIDNGTGGQQPTMTSIFFSIIANRCYVEFALATAVKTGAGLLLKMSAPPATLPTRTSGDYTPFGVAAFGWIDMPGIVRCATGTIWELVSPISIADNQNVGSSGGAFSYEF